jgi:NAD(P)H-dependent FMN reductase
VINLLFFSGSSLIGSAHWKLAGSAAHLARIAFSGEVEVTVIDLANFALPSHTPSSAGGDNKPAGVDSLNAHIARTDGIFLSSDEYTGTYSALLKNAVSWLIDERLDPAVTLHGMPIALCGTSARGVGGLRGQPALEQFLTELGANIISQHLELGTSSTPFDMQGALLPKIEAQLLKGCLGKLVDVARHRHGAESPHPGANPSAA